METPEQTPDAPDETTVPAPSEPSTGDGEGGQESGGLSA